MAPLPDPTSHLHGDDRAIFEHMASVRTHAEGRAQLGEVYVRMFNNPGVAGKVGALGEHLRFHGTVPDAVRELVILRVAGRRRYGYEWAHHLRPARLAGMSQDAIDALAQEAIPHTLPPASQAVLQAVDAVLADHTVPSDVQARLVDAYGTEGVVEIVVLCGLYTLLGYMTKAFDIPVEEGLTDPGF